MSETAFQLHVFTAVFDRLGLAIIYALAVTAIWLSPSTTLSEGARRLRLFTSVLVIILITACLDLILRTAALADVGLQDTWPYIFRVLDDSDYGYFWQWRIGMWWLMVLAALWIFATDWSRRAALIILLATMATALFESATSHAGENGLWTLANVVNTVHLVSTLIWGGTVIVYAVRVLPDLRRHREGRQTGTAVERLSSVAGVALALVLLSGVFNTWRQLQHFSDLWTSEYGRILLIKLALVGVMMAIGTLNRFRWVPRVVDSAAQPGGTSTAPLQFFHRVLRVDAVVFITIIIAASILGATSPPGHG
jgi:putative copper resistance protein D